MIRVAFLLLSPAFFPAKVWSTVDAPLLESSAELATAGFYTLNWTSTGNEFELQQSSGMDFQQVQVLYTGPDTATVISGMSDGLRYYRIRNIDNGHAGPWSDTVQVTVQHHTLTRALLFLLTGLIVFLATVLLIALGAKTHRE